MISNGYVLDVITIMIKSVSLMKSLWEMKGLIKLRKK
jgi:hypothetical protein